MRAVETIFILTLLVFLVAGILVAGFLLRPRWPSADTLAKEARSQEETKKKVPELSPAEENRRDTCLENQVEIRASITSYKAGEGVYPPLGTVNDKSPLIEKGFLRHTPACPSTNKEYQVIHPIEYLPPTTKGPSGLETHFLP